ncbi:hypothetical protein [Acinetobacter seifertii]|uniref:hypothetical protein n=1 Tax=Acinetobacter seifertii TaxID=1530123 RepID=UPI00168BD6F3|nr:hypothetical protein [Acinetobacter seifertii]QNX88267.1 hypothetical protein IC772_03785 [Acinetobacter seifertii]
MIINEKAIAKAMAFFYVLGIKNFAIVVNKKLNHSKVLELFMSYIKNRVYKAKKSQKIHVCLSMI